MNRGTIVRVVSDKGFGFIRPCGEGEDVFFHASTVQGGLEFSDQLRERLVEFEVEFDQRRGKTRCSSVWPATN